jgi:hypothetical protein
MSHIGTLGLREILIKEDMPIGKRKKGITQDHNKSQQIHGIHIQVMYANLLDLS